MPSNDKLRSLRKAIDSIQQQVSELSKRLDELEDGETQPEWQDEELDVPIPLETLVGPAASSPIPPPLPAVKPSRHQTSDSKHPHAPQTPVAQPVLSKAPEPNPVLNQDLWDALASGPVGRYIDGRVKDLQRRTRELGWEVILGTYWLPRAAVVCIAIAVVFFLSLAIERWGVAWMPHLRLAIGYAVAAGLLTLAWRSESKYRGFARVLYGGGFAVMYFVTFATYYIQFARVFSRPEPTLVLLAAIVAAWAVVAQVRRSKIVAVLVTGLGHFTVLLSTLTLGGSGSFATAGLLALSGGSAFFLLKNHWYYVASLGLTGTYLNTLVFTLRIHGDVSVAAFAVNMAIVAAFFAIYSLAELFSPEETRRQTVPAWFRNAYVTANSFSVLVLGTIIMAQCPFTRDHQDVFRFAMAAALMLMGLGYLRLRERDPLFNVYLVKSVAMITFALATRYGSSALAAWLAVETVVLLLSARRSGLVVVRLLAFGAGIIAFVQSLDTALGMMPIGYHEETYLPRLVQALISIASFFVASQVYERTDWTSRSLKSAALPEEFTAILWELDLVAENPMDAKQAKPVGGLLFSYLYAIPGTVLFIAYALPLVAVGHQFTAIAVFACLLTVLAFLLKSKPFGLSAIVFYPCTAFLFGSHELLTLSEPNADIFAIGLVASAIVALASEHGFVGNRDGLTFHQHKAAPYFLYGAGAWLVGLLLMKEFHGLFNVYALVAAAVIAAALFLVLHATAFTGICAAYLLWASALFGPRLMQFSTTVPARFTFTAGLLVVLSLALDRYFSYHEKRAPITVYACAAGVINAMAVLLFHAEYSLPNEWLISITAVFCYCFLAYAAQFRSLTAVFVSAATIAYASWRQILMSLAATGLETGLVVAFLMLAAYWLLAERIYDWMAARITERVQINHPEWRVALPAEIALLPIAIACLLLVVLIDRIPHLAHLNLAFITMGWFGLAAAMFVFSLLFIQRFYRYAGLALILLSLGRLFLIDMKEQDPLLRVAAFAVVGAGLLCISIGYYKWMNRTRQARHSQDRTGSN